MAAMMDNNDFNLSYAAYRIFMTSAADDPYNKEQPAPPL